MLNRACLLSNFYCTLVLDALSCHIYKYICISVPAGCQIDCISHSSKHIGRISAVFIAVASFSVK